jgi:alpha-tubulin suppressor-like RCC1 family protein
MPILATAIGVGEQSACAVVRGGTVACWGDDTYGELGIGSSAGLPTCESGACSTVAVAVPGLTHVAAVSVGEATACALLESGAVECWGDNTYGELGNGSATGPGTCGSEATPCAMSPVSTGVSEAIAISVGTESACALIYGGTVECWGDNSLGELGTGSTSGPETCGGNSCSTTPVAVPGITSAIAISVGSGAACALLQNGTVQCWGLDAYGELGNGQAGAITPEPVTVSGLTGATGISVNIVGGACALVSSATAECWGNGYPTLTPSADVTGLSNATAVAGFCALVYGGGVSCWPSVAGDDAGLPATAVTSISTATSVSAVTSQDTCALLSSGDVVCWGYNAFGQLGDGTTDDSTTPVTVVQ